MGFRRKSAPSRQPVIPGERCPAVRTNSSRDPNVTTTRTLRGGREGTTTCAMCGSTVAVSQATSDDGAPMTAWYYGPHTVPTKEGSLP
ncbi:hypothetical protein [Leifsonia sp. Leaf264]|uniref:hypothetical protein n=1 Tax=Leifsonia sp. Leaf264 TaxID=1736314 RepID=UPI000A9508A5|nr:hypothetical protein [Leifsonia sp. Leaf264]